MLVKGKRRKHDWAEGEVEFPQTSCRSDKASAHPARGSVVNNSSQNCPWPSGKSWVFILSLTEMWAALGKVWSWMKRKNSFPSVLLCCESPLLLTQNTSLVTFLVTAYVEVNPTESNSLQHQLGVHNLTQFWHYLLKIVPDTMDKGSDPQTPTLLQVPVKGSRPPGYPQLLSSLATNQGFPSLPPQLQVIC